jgi:pimeloyl-ACP methyl ester carboxylesterase
MAKQSIRTIDHESGLASTAVDGLKGLAGFSTSFLLAVAGSWILYSRLAIDHAIPLPDALPAERKTFTSGTAGRLSYYRSPVDSPAPTEAGARRPLVLIHSINAAASAYEMRPLFLHYRAQRPVFALDLPGYGFSDRSRRVYSPGMYESALLDLLQTEVGEPADVVALSLGSEFAARAALAQPDLFHSLVMISPTGFNAGQENRGSQKASRNGMGELLHALFAFPFWARPFYDLLTTHASIQYFLQKSFIGAVPHTLIEYAYATAHQPGAENAPLYFISGKLFTPRVRQDIYQRLQTPTLVLYDRDNFTNFSMLPDLLARNPAWQAVRLVPTLGLPQFERIEDTVEVLDKFWR